MPARHFKASQQLDLFGAAADAFMNGVDDEARDILVEAPEAPEAPQDASHESFGEAHPAIPPVGASGRSSTERSTCPVAEIVDAYNALSGLAAVRPAQFMRNSARMARLRKRWDECFGRDTGSAVLPYYATIHSGIDAWKFLFDSVRQMPGLHGGFGSWRADLDWIIGRENFDKLIYHPERYRMHGHGAVVDLAPAEAFLAAYPPDRIGSRSDVTAFWITQALNSRAGAIMDGLARWKASLDWVDPRYIPSARKFLSESRYLAAPRREGAHPSATPDALSADVARHAAQATSASISMRKTVRLGSPPMESGDWRAVRFELPAGEQPGAGTATLLYLVSENSIVIERGPVRINDRALAHVGSYGDRIRIGFCLAGKLHPYVRQKAEAALAKALGLSMPAHDRAPDAVDVAGILGWADQTCGALAQERAWTETNDAK